MISSDQTRHACAHPSWFPVSLDADTQEIRLVRTTRAELSSATFLDGRSGLQGGDSRTLSFAEAGKIFGRSGAGATSMPVFIFHTAFCCSTLLARALDRPGLALALKEPDALMHLANIPRSHPQWVRDRARFQDLARTVFALLGRRFQAEEHVVVKPTNAANRLLPAAVASGAHILLLYSDLPSFLVSVIKKGEACRYFVRHLLNIFRLDRPDIDAWPAREAMLLTDLQVAALVWNIQIDLFEHALAHTDERQVRSLNVDEFLRDPESAMLSVQRFFELDYTAAEVAEIAASSLFRRHAKFSEQDYDESARAAEKAQIMEQYSEEIATTLEWTRRLRQSAVPAQLAHPL